MGNKNKIDIAKEMELKHLNDADVENLLEKKLNSMKFETAKLILEIGKNDFDKNINSKLLWLSTEYKILRQKALSVFVKWVILDWKKIEKAYVNLSEIQVELLTDLSLQHEIKNKLLSWEITLQELKTRFSELWLEESFFNRFINILAYGGTVDNISKLWDTYTLTLKNAIESYTNATWTKPSEEDINKIKDQIFVEVIDSFDGDGFVSKVLVPVYGNISTAREVFEHKCVVITNLDKKWKMDWRWFWDEFKKKGVFWMIRYYIEKSPMDKTHKEAAILLSQFAVTISLVVWLWKMITSDCLIKWKNGCVLKWWFLNTASFLWAAEFGYNWGTEGKHSLVDLVTATLTWWLDESYIPFSNKSKSNTLSKRIDSQKVNESKINVELRKEITDPLLIIILFPNNTIKDIKSHCFDKNQNKVDLIKLLDYLKNKAQKDPSYVFSYMLVKGILDSNNSTKKRELEESINSGIEMLSGYGENKKVDEIYNNEYLKRYVEVAQIKEKIFDTKTQLGSQTQEAIKQNKAKINEILRKYLENKIDKQTMIKELESIPGLETFMKIVFTSKNSVKNNTTIPNTSTNSNKPNINALL